MSRFPHASGQRGSKEMTASEQIRASTALGIGPGVCSGVGHEGCSPAFREVERAARKCRLQLVEVGRDRVERALNQMRSSDAIHGSLRP